MPLTIEGGFALILTGTIVPERVVIMTTSFVYFILAAISILLCVVRHGIAAAAAERLAQETPKPVIEEVPEQVSGTDELRARLVEIGRKHASTRAYHDRHGKNVEDFRERTMAELFPGSTRNVASVAIVISCLFAVGCGGLRPANNPSFGIPIMSMAVITAVIALFITSLTLVGKEGDEALDNSLEGSVKGGRRGGILLNNKLITETELAKMQQLHAEDQAHDEPIQGPYGLPDPTLPDWDGLYESEVPSHKRWPKRVFKGGRRTDKSRQRAARKTSIERRRARPA